MTIPEPYKVLRTEIRRKEGIHGSMSNIKNGRLENLSLGRNEKESPFLKSGTIISHGKQFLKEHL